MAESDQGVPRAAVATQESGRSDSPPALYWLHTANQDGRISCLLQPPHERRCVKKGEFLEIMK